VVEQTGVLTCENGCISFSWGQKKRSMAMTRWRDSINTEGRGWGGEEVHCMAMKPENLNFVARFWQPILDVAFGEAIDQ